MNRVFASAVTFCLFCAGAHAQDTSDQFYNFIRNDDVAGVRALLKSSVDVNTRDKKGSTPLMYAAAVGSLNVMTALLDAGADVNAKNGLDATALLWCTGDLEKVRLLVKRGADVNATSKMMRTPLILAAHHSGGAPMVKFLLDSGADVKARTKAGMDAIVFAADADDVESMRLLLAKAGDSIADGPTLPMSLMDAAANGDTAAVKLLLSKGADVNAASPPESGPPVKNGRIALGRFTALILAVADGNPETIKVLLDAGANVNAKDVRGMTPLMLAIASDRHNPEIIRMLLEKGADTAVKTTAGESALDWAEKMSVPAIYASLKMQPKKTLSVSMNDNPADLTEAVRKSVGLLQRSADSFFKEGGCVSCHAQNLTAMAVQAARSKGVSVDEQIAKAQARATVSNWASQEQKLLQADDPGGAADQVTYAAMALAAIDHAPDRTTDALVHVLATWQRPEGNWHFGGVVRPPMEDGDFSRTAFGLRTFQLYGMAGRKPEMEQRILRAKKWLLHATPQTNEDHAMQLMGLKWAVADAKSIDALTSAFIHMQRSDGGWAQTEYLASDAYATGQALHALYEAGVSPSDPAYQRGVQFLLKTQLSDGSWHVKSRAAKFQPYFQSGFPHDHDQWISASATAWATIALSHAVPAKPGKNLTAQR